MIRSMTTTTDRIYARPRHPRDPLVVAVAGLVFLLAGALAGVRYIGATPAEWGVERVLASVALGAVLAMPGILAVLARAGRPSLLTAAGAGLVPLSLVALSGVTLPLLIPAVLLLVAGSRRPGPAGTRPCAPAPVTTLVVIVLAVVAVLALFAHADPRTWGGPSSGGSTSDVVTVTEALGALGLVGVALAAAWYLATPVVRARPRPVDRPGESH